MCLAGVCAPNHGVVLSSIRHDRPAVVASLYNTVEFVPPSRAVLCQPNCTVRCDRHPLRGAMSDRVDPGSTFVHVDKDRLAIRVVTALGALRIVSHSIPPKVQPTVREESAHAEQDLIVRQGNESAASVFRRIVNGA